MFNPIHVVGRTLDDTWFNLLRELFYKGRKYLITDGSFAGAYRLAFDDISGFITNPHERPLSPTLPPGVSPPCADNDIEQYFAEYIMNGKKQPNEDYKYATFIVGGGIYDSRRYPSF